MLQFSTHAREMMVARGILTQEVQEAIQKGSKTLQSDGKIVSCYRYYCVVYKKIKDVYVIITVKPRW